MKVFARFGISNSEVSQVGARTFFRPLVDLHGRDFCPKDLGIKRVVCLEIAAASMTMRGRNFFIPMNLTFVRYKPNNFCAVSLLMHAVAPSSDVVAHAYSDFSREDGLVLQSVPYIMT